MAVAGRSIQGTTIIFGAAQTTNDVGRATLADPPVLTTEGPIVVSAQNLRPFTRVQGWGLPLSDQNLGPVYRSTLQDLPVLTTPDPVVVTSQPARIWLKKNTPQTFVAPILPPPPPPPPPAIVVDNPYAATWFKRNTPQTYVAPVIPVPFVRHPLQLGGTWADTSTLGGSVTVVATTLGGAAVVVNPDLGGTTTVHLLGGTATVETGGGNTIVVDEVDGTLLGWSMQEVDITLAEFNDETVDLALTSGGSALNLTGYTSVDMFLKPAKGIADTDPSVLKLSSAGGSPQITITNVSGGLATAQINATQITATNPWAFYRVDAVDGTGKRNTAIFGNVTIQQL